jgi:drug/metabolite transporter (DMT)-like permease/ubiquinone/menaquinone biosynthesis C-methylase UbiE
MSFTAAMLFPFFIREAVADRIGKKKTRQSAAVKDILLCVISGIFLAIHFATWIESLRFTSIASATVLVNTHPIFVFTVGFLFLKERLSKTALIYAVIALAGMVLLSVGDISHGKSTFRGDLLALAGALSVSGYMLIGRIVRQRMKLTSYVFIVYSICALILLGMCIVTGVPLTGYPVSEYLIFFGLAFFCTILGHTVFNWSLKHLKTSFVSIAILGEPVYATVLGIIIFKEVPPTTAIAGGCIVLFGLFAFVRKETAVDKNNNVFDDKAKDWDGNPAIVERNQAIAHAIADAVPLSKQMRALDYGAGTGQLSTLLCTRLQSVLAVDTSEGMLDQLKNKVDQNNKITPLKHDLSVSDLPGRKFNLIYSAMTMHHIEDVSLVLKRFYNMLEPDGYIALADLVKEDGSFHNSMGHIPHTGFEPEELAGKLRETGFASIAYKQIYIVKKEIDDTQKEFPVFLITAQKYQ